jgi:short subunit fatty acids transporter
VARRAPLLTVVSWLGGAASLLPFAEEWFELSSRLGNLALLLAVASAVALGLAVRLAPTFRRLTERLAGPPDRPARALVLVAVFASAGAVAMLVLTALLALV